MFGVTEDNVLNYAEVSSNECYGDRVDMYRRGVAMVDLENSAYLLDVFWVRGGKTHDYSIHSFDAPLQEKSGIELIEQATGTLAGKDVPFEYLYDDVELEQPDKKRSFGSYKGSGYSFLTDVRRSSPGRAFRLTWKGDEAGLQMSFLGDGLEDVALSRGRPPRREANPLAVDFVRLRKESDAETASLFVTLIHPFDDEPLVRGANIFDRDDDGNLQIMVLHEQGEDVVTIRRGEICRLERYCDGQRKGTWRVAAAAGWPEPWRVAKIDADRNRVLISDDAMENRTVSKRGNGDARSSPPRLTLLQKVWGTDFNPLLTSPDLRGRKRDELVCAVFSPKRATLAWPSRGDSEGVDTSLPALRRLFAASSSRGEIQRGLISDPQPGDTIIFRNNDRASSYTIRDIDQTSNGWWIDLGDDRPIIGRVKVAEVDPEENIVRSVWSLHTAKGGRYDGSRLISQKNRDLSFRIDEGGGKDLRLKESRDLKRVSAGAEFWIEDFGVGDEAVICRTEAVASESQH